MTADVRHLGEVDSPAAGEHVRGDLLRVAGWMLLDGRPPAKVEVLTDHGDVVARTYLPRPDVAATFPHIGYAACSGYEARLALDVPPGEARTIGLRVRGRADDGREWTSPVRFCTVRNPPADAGDERRAEHAVASTGELLAAVPRRRDGARKVAVFTHGLGIGGGQLWLHELLTGLVKTHGWDAVVISPDDGPLRDECEDLGIPVHVTSPYRVGSTAAYEGHVTELALLARSTGASVAFVNTLGAFAAADAATRAGLPTAWTIHESFSLADFSYLNWGPAGLSATVRSRWERTLRRTDRLLFVADATRELHLPLSTPTRCRTVRYGTPMVDIGGRVSDRARRRARRDLGIAPDATVLLSVGVVEPRKGQGPLIAAFDRIKDVHPELVLALVGAHPSPYALALEELVAHRGLGDRVRLVPIQRDPLPWFEAADVFVNSSDIESLPRSILEAVCCGLPVVASDVFGAREMIVDRESGWLFEANDTTALTTALLRALDTPPDERAAIAGRAWSALSDWLDPATYVADYHALLSELSDEDRR